MDEDHINFKQIEINIMKRLAEERKLAKQQQQSESESNFWIIAITVSCALMILIVFLTE